MLVSVVAPASRCSPPSRRLCDRAPALQGRALVGLAIFLAYLVPPSILFIPLAPIVFSSACSTPAGADPDLPDVPDPVLHLAADGLLPHDPVRARGVRADRRRDALADPDKIVLPLAVPGLISAGIFAFTLSWNEFIYALTFISSSAIKTMPVGRHRARRGDVYHWGALMAGALLGSLPVVVLYSFFVEYYVSAMTGAVKE